jgi:hypothetical protein
MGPMDSFRDGFRPETYGDRIADVYDDWYANLDPGPPPRFWPSSRATGAPSSSRSAPGGSRCR